MFRAADLVLACAGFQADAPLGVADFGVGDGCGRATGVTRAPPQPRRFSSSA
jgi:hypothetical protein